MWVIVCCDVVMYVIRIRVLSGVVVCSLVVVRCSCVLRSYIVVCSVVDVCTVIAYYNMYYSVCLNVYMYSIV